jgi:1-deoxyxylulose-5-phosphate synthase
MRSTHDSSLRGGRLTYLKPQCAFKTRPKPKTNMIKQRTMGRTGLKLSELALGTLNLGWKTDETVAHAILDAYYAAGGNFLQASSLSPDLSLPSASTRRSEEIVGRWWTARQVPRQRLFIATRIYVRRSSPGDASFINAVREAVKHSLRRLQTDYIDMVIFEWHDGLVPMGSTLKAFDFVVQSGAARFIGAANFPAWRVADSLGRAYLGNHNRMEALQADYSLMTRARFEPEAMALCEDYRLGFFATSPLAGGFLAHHHDLDSLIRSVRRERLIERFGNAYGQRAQSAVAKVAARQGASLAQVALSWVLYNPIVTSAVVGVHSVAQLNDLLRGTSLTLSTADRENLDRATAAEEVLVAVGDRAAGSRPRQRMVN